MMAKTCVAGLFLLMLAPTTLFAQASITGVVRDSSGAILPGVTVEASSPALIERTRTVVTDGTGQYRIVDLRPGIYAVTFTLSGFNTLRREGIELSGSFIATVNADLVVGSVEQTVTVTAEAALVDVQSTTQQRVLGHDVADTVPSSRMPSGLGALIPGMVTAISAANFTGLGSQEVGGAGGDTTTNLSIHGGQNTDFFIFNDAPTTEKTLVSTGHRWLPIPCVDANGLPTDGQTCAVSARSFRSCTASGCHGTEGAARAAFLTAEADINGLVAQLDGMIAQVPANQFGANKVNAGRGAKFNSEMAKMPGSEVHNPFMMKALLRYSGQALHDTYGIPLPPGLAPTAADAQRVRFTKITH